LTDTRIRIKYDDNSIGSVIIRESGALEDETDFDYVRGLGVQTYTDFLLLIRKIASWLQSHDVKEIRLDEI